MKIGGPESPPERPHYQSPAEELHENVLAAFEDANVITRMQLAESLQQGTPWAELSPAVRALFEAVADGMGISD